MDSYIAQIAVYSYLAKKLYKLKIGFGMIIFHQLHQPCPYCGQLGKYGNINITGDILNRGCNACMSRGSIHLPKLHKKIIYLDQFFFSSAFRDHDQRFVMAAQRIHHISA